MLKRKEEISHFYDNKNKKGNELIIPKIKDINNRKKNFGINKINYKLKKEINFLKVINKKK